MLLGASYPIAPSNSSGATCSRGGTEQTESGRHRLQDTLARILPRLATLISLQCGMDGAGHTAVRRDVGVADLDQFAGVILSERGAFQRGAEHLCVDALVAVVDRGILISVLHGNLGVARRQACPNLREDKRTAAVTVDIVDVAGKRGEQTGGEVVFPGTVLSPIGNNVHQPIFPENGAIDRAAVLLGGVEPDQLQVEVVVGKRFTVGILRIELDREDAPFAFERRAQRTADVLAQPAAQHLVAIVMEVQLHWVFTFSNLKISLRTGIAHWH